MSTQPEPSVSDAGQNASVEIARTEGATELYVFFGGIATGLGMPPFEFYNAARIVDAHKVFVRDFRQSWYHAGLSGVSRDIPSTAAFLERTLDEIGPKRVTFVGNSMGGFAAMLFATLTGRGRAIAFAPQTFVSPSLRRQHRDRRWKREIRGTWLRAAFKPKIYDLRPLLLERPPAHPVSIFVSEEDRLDSVHAEHMRGVPGVTIHESATGGHNVVKVLRDEGRLPAILAGEVD